MERVALKITPVSPIAISSEDPGLALIEHGLYHNTEGLKIAVDEVSRWLDRREVLVARISDIVREEAARIAECRQGMAKVLK